MIPFVFHFYQWFIKFKFMIISLVVNYLDIFFILYIVRISTNLNNSYSYNHLFMLLLNKLLLIYFLNIFKFVLSVGIAPTASDYQPYI